MPDSLREFVYLDDVSVNSHLSSLGIGLPEEVIDSEELSKMKKGGADVKVLKGGASSETSSGTETTRSVTAPYRYEELLEALNEEDIEIHDDPDVRSVTRGDVVRLSGDIIPLSLYKIEIAAKAVLSHFEGFIEQGLIDDIEDLSEDSTDHGVDLEEEDTPDSERVEKLLEFIELFNGLAEQFIGDSVPVRIDCIDSDDSYVTHLDRTNFRKPHGSEFFNEKSFVVFGRIESTVPRNDSWEPIQTKRVESEVMAGEGGFGDELDDTVREAGSVLDMDIDQDEISVPGPTAEVHPFAVYW